jgi:hypothetical protein
MNSVPSNRGLYANSEIVANIAGTLSYLNSLKSRSRTTLLTRHSGHDLHLSEPTLDVRYAP